MFFQEEIWTESCKKWRKVIELTGNEFGFSTFDDKSPAEHVWRTHQGHFATREYQS